MPSSVVHKVVMLAITDRELSLLSCSAINMTPERGRTSSAPVTPEEHHDQHMSLAILPSRTYGIVHMKTVKAQPYLLHPLASSPSNYTPSQRNESAHVKHSSSDVRSASVSSTETVICAGDVDVGQDPFAEQHFARAAEQLYFQLKESRKMYHELGQAYEDDIEKVKSYVSEETRRRIWAEKVRQDQRWRTGTGNEGQLVHHDRLTTCLRFLNGAGERILKERLSGNHTDYDTRALQLGKLLAAGDRVHVLVEQALTSWEAFRDLSAELRELRRLVVWVVEAQQKRSAGSTAETGRECDS